MDGIDWGSADEYPIERSKLLRNDCGSALGLSRSRGQIPYSTPFEKLITRSLFVINLNCCSQTDYTEPLLWDLGVFYGSTMPSATVADVTGLLPRRYQEEILARAKKGRYNSFISDKNSIPHGF